MTKEEAINTFKEWIERDKKMEYADRLENIEIYNIAIKALGQKPCEDCISRQAVLDLVNSDWKYEGLKRLLQVYHLSHHSQRQGIG